MLKPLGIAKSFSVHAELMPEVKEELIDERLEANMEVVRKLFEVVANARQKAGIKLRWVVKKVVVESEDEKIMRAVNELNEVCKRVFNAKEVVACKSFKPSQSFVGLEFEKGRVLIDTSESKEILTERLLRDFVRNVQELRKKHGFNVKERIELTVDSELNELIKELASEIAKEVNASKVEVGRLEGEFKGEFKFKEKVIRVAFRRI